MVFVQDGMFNMSTYIVAKNNHFFYVMPFDVEMYVRKGYELYTETNSPIEDVDKELSIILKEMTSMMPDYWAKKDGITFKIQPFRIKEFSDRGYDILTKQIVKIENPYDEIDKINASDDILPL